MSERGQQQMLQPFAREVAKDTQKVNHHRALLGVVDSELARDVVVVGGVALGRNAGDLGLLNLVVPALLLAEVDRVFLGAELERSALHVIASVVGCMWTSKDSMRMVSSSPSGAVRCDRLCMYVRRRPAHQRVLPSCRALEDIKVDTPHLGAGLARRVGGLGGTEDADRALSELLCCFGMAKQRSTRRITTSVSRLGL
ncbi:hypothetical protein L1887_56915 [Cichorium endivia]|nr:hypothetical protein L1887_56915 [Cichorium endivia]